MSFFATTLRRLSSSVEPAKKSYFPLVAGVAVLAGGAYYYYSTCTAKPSTASPAAPTKKALIPGQYVPFTVRELKDINHNTKLIRFNLPSEEHVLGLPVSSCVLVSITENDKTVVRPYTPTTSDDTKGHFDMIIKKYPNGPVSTYLHSLKPGDVVNVQGPRVKLPYTANMKKKIGMIAGGTGLTPMLQVVNEILKNPEDKTEVSFLFANISEADILLKDELDRKAKEHPNFKVYYTVDKPGWTWKGFKGFVSDTMVKSTMPEPSADSLVMVCGPDGMLKHVCGEKGPNYTQGDVNGLLKGLGYNSDNVFKF